jgi:hypothetical protein
MSTKLHLKEHSSTPDAHLPEASDFRSDDVVRITLDDQLRPIHTPAPKEGAPKLRKWASYLPFWDDGFWMASDRKNKSSDSEYSI